MSKKHIFETCIRHAVAEIRSGGLTSITEVPASTKYPERLVKLDTWSSPATVSEYDEADFASSLSVNDRHRLTELVAQFRELCNTFDPKKPIPTDEAPKASKIIVNISKILESQPLAGI